MEPVLEVRSLFKSFHGNPVLNDLSLSIHKGKIFGLIGGSGAGKSTLTRLILGLEYADRGEILFRSQPLKAQHKSHMGCVFQNFNLLNSKTALENVLYPCRKKDREKGRSLLKIVGLEGKEDLYPAQMSGGQKQRVGIARALILDPLLLLCDEATSALDPENTQAILDLLYQINKEFGTTILLITHEMDVIKALCHEVGVLHKGEIVEHGEIHKLIAHPKHPITRNFLQSSIRGFSRPKLGAFYRFAFYEESAKRPLIAEVILQWGIEINIIRGGIDHLRHTPFGTLIVEIKGDKKSRSQALDQLQAAGVEIEELQVDAV